MTKKKKPRPIVPPPPSTFRSAPSNSSVKAALAAKVGSQTAPSISLKSRSAAELVSSHGKARSQDSSFGVTSPDLDLILAASEESSSSQAVASSVVSPPVILSQASPLVVPASPIPVASPSAVPPSLEAESSGASACPPASPADNPSDKTSFPPPRSYAAVARPGAGLAKLGTPTKHVSGVPFILIPDANVEAAKEEFKDYIYAQFHGPSPDMGRIIGEVNVLWARSGPRIFVHRIGPGTFLLRATNPRTRAILLSRNLWNIAGHPMFVAPWSPDFTPEKPPLTKAQVTVEFRGVPYLLFNDESLSRIASGVGEPIALHPETARKETFEVAKILVEVNLLEELPTKLVSGFSDGREFQIEVSYPWLPPKCSSCGEFGHTSLRCPSVPASQAKRDQPRSKSRGARRRGGRGGSRQGRVLSRSKSPPAAAPASLENSPKSPSPSRANGVAGVGAAECIHSHAQAPGDSPAPTGAVPAAEAPFLLVSHKNSSRKAART